MIYWGAGPPRPAASEGSVSCRLAYASRILLIKLKNRIPNVCRMEKRVVYSFIFQITTTKIYQ